MPGSVSMYRLTVRDQRPRTDSVSSQGIGETHSGATKHPCQRTTLAPCQRRQEDRRVSIGLLTERGCFTNFPVAQKSPRRVGQGHLLGPAVRDATPLHDAAHDPSTMRRHLLHRRIHQCGEVLLLAAEVANDHNIEPLDCQGRSLVPGPHQPHATNWTPVAPSILMHDPHARCTAICGDTRYLSTGRRTRSLCRSTLRNARARVTTGSAPQARHRPRSKSRAQRPLLLGVRRSRSENFRRGGRATMSPPRDRPVSCPRRRVAVWEAVKRLLSQPGLWCWTPSS